MKVEKYDFYLKVLSKPYFHIKLGFYEGHTIKVFFSVIVNSELVYSKNDFNLTNICFEPIQWQQISTPGLNRGLLSNFYWLRSVNHVKFIKECVMRTKKHVSVKKYPWMGQTWVCHYETEWKMVHSGNIVTSKEKIPGAVVSKGHSDYLPIWKDLSLLISL